MSLDHLVSRIHAELPELLILENEPMSKHTSFRIGGPVRALVQPQSAGEVAAVCRLLRDAEAADSRQRHESARDG